MSVYTDPIVPCVRSKNWRWAHSAHLFADTPDELHVFAKRLKLKRLWFQDGGFFPHYDLTSYKHAEAVKLGAVLLTRERAILKWHSILRGKP